MLKLWNIPLFYLWPLGKCPCAHSDISAAVTQRPRSKVMSTENCSPGEEPKVEHSGAEVVDTSLISTMDENKRLQRSAWRRLAERKHSLM